MKINIFFPIFLIIALILVAKGLVSGWALFLIVLADVKIWMNLEK